VAGESDERASAFARGAGESHGLGAFGLDAGDYHQCESTTAQELFRPAQPVLSAARSDENRAFFPERTGNRSQSIDPHCSLALGNGRVTRCSQHSGRSTLRHPDSQSSARQSVAGENRIERIDSSCDWLRRPVGDRGGIGKLMLDECADGGGAIGHWLFRISRTYPEGKKGTSG
jgi:hypothetical protein